MCFNGRDRCFGTRDERGNAMGEKGHGSHSRLRISSDRDLDDEIVNRVLKQERPGRPYDRTVRFRFRRRLYTETRPDWRRPDA